MRTAMPHTGSRGRSVDAGVVLMTVMLPAGEAKPEVRRSRPARHGRSSGRRSARFMSKSVAYLGHHEPMLAMDWLLDSDPAIRWQVMRDLSDAPTEQVAAERACVAREGWG